MLRVLMLAIGLMAASAAYADEGFDFGVDTGDYDYADPDVTGAYDASDFDIDFVDFGDASYDYLPCQATTEDRK